MAYPTNTRAVLVNLRTKFQYPITVLDNDRVTWQTNNEMFEIFDRSEPVVAVHPMKSAAGALRILAKDMKERLQIGIMVEGGDIMHVETACPDQLLSFSFTVESMTEEWLARDYDPRAKIITLNYRVVATSPVGDLSGWTYDDAAQKYATYDAAAAAFANYDASVWPP